MTYDIFLSAIRKNAILICNVVLETYYGLRLHRVLSLIDCTVHAILFRKLEYFYFIVLTLVLQSYVHNEVSMDFYKCGCE